MYALMRFLRCAPDVFIPSAFISSGVLSPATFVLAILTSSPSSSTTVIESALDFSARFLSVYAKNSSNSFWSTIYWAVLRIQ